MTSFSPCNVQTTGVAPPTDPLDLPEWLQTIAEAEIREPPTREGKIAAIEELRSSLESQSQATPPVSSLITPPRRDLSDGNLLRWLRASKFDQAKAIDKLNQHAAFYATHAQALVGLDSAPGSGEFECFEKFLQLVRGVEGMQGRVVVCLCPKKAVSRMSKAHVASHPHLLLRFNVWMLERLALDTQVQICGLVVLNSFHALTLYEGWTLQSIVSISERRVVLGFFSILGFRLQAAMLFEEPLVINLIFSLVRQFMSAKLRDRLSLNGSRYAAIDAVLPEGARQQLPEPFRSGGKAGFGPADEAEGEGWVAAQIRLAAASNNTIEQERKGT